MNEFIKVALRADSTNLEKGFASGQAALKGFRKGLQLTQGAVAKVDNVLKGIGTRAAAMSASLTAAMVAAGKGAMDFETSMRNVNSIMKQSEDEFRQTGDTIVDMSRQIPRAAKDMADGLYDIASSGFQGADGLHVLETASIGAVAGLTETATASQGITAVLNAYGLGAEHAADVSDILFKTVDVGVLTFGDLVQQVGDFVPVGQAAGIEFDQLGSAMAALTRLSFPPAQAATALTGVMRAFIKPSEAMQEAVKSLGYENAAAMLQSRGLKGALDDLNDSVDGNITTMGQLFQDTEGLRGVLALTSNGGRVFGEALDQIANESNRAGAAQDAYTEQSKSTAVQLQLFKNSVTAARIEIGQYYLPVVSEVLEKGGSLLNMFGELPGPVKGSVAAFMGLVQAFTALGAMLLISRVRQNLYQRALAQMPDKLRDSLVGTKSFTGGILKLGTTAAHSSKLLGAVGTASAKVAAGVNATRGPVGALGTSFERLAMSTAGYQGKSKVLAATTGTFSRNILRASASLQGYSSRTSVAGARTTALAGKMATASKVAGGFGRAMVSIRNSLPSVGTAMTAGFLLFDAFTTSVNGAKSGVEEFNSEVAQKHDLSSVHGMNMALREMRANYLTLKEESDDNSGFWSNVRSTGQLLNPAADNTVIESRAATEAQADAVNKLDLEYRNAVKSVNAFIASTGLSGREGEALAKTLGVDLTQGLSLTEQMFYDLYENGVITGKQFGELISSGDGVAATLYNAATAASEGKFELSTLGEQLRLLNSPIESVTGEIVELTEAQKALMQASQEIGSPMKAWTEALTEKKDERQSVIDDEIKSLEDASEARIEAAEKALDAKDDEHQATIDSLADSDASAEAVEDAERRRKTAREQGQESLEDLRKREAEVLEQQRQDLQKTVEDQVLTLGDYTTALQKQNNDLETWKQNLVIVSARAGEDVARYLASMGEEGVDLVALMASGSQEEVEAMKNEIVRNMEATGSESAVELSAGMSIAAQAAKLGAEATRRAVLDELGLLPSDVDGIMNQYATSIEKGMNQVLGMLGLDPISLAAPPAAPDPISETHNFTRRAPAPVYGPFQIPQASEGNIFEEHEGVMFNEPGVGGEAYIPLGVGNRNRSIRLWGETGKRLGILPMASGGILGFDSQGSSSTVYDTKVEKRSDVNFNGPMYLSDAESVLRYAERRRRMAKMRGQ